MKLARLLVPALRWNDEDGFAHERERIEQSIERGVGGFIIFGGEAGAVRELCAELHERAPHPPLIASDLERGAGQQFRGATPLPPAAALGWLDDEATTRRAGEVTARDARGLGVNWVYAPIADVDLEPQNPIIGVRAFGTEPAHVARHVSAWIEGCAAGGALSCAKHFPGHGRTVADSHAEKPVVDALREPLDEDLVPFRAASSAGADSMMTAHVAYPALDPSGVPATLSGPILKGLLRGEIGYEGLIVTDALIMEGFIEDLDECRAAVLAMHAGCDVLLYPEDEQGIIEELQRALDDGRLEAGRVENALSRIEEAAARVSGPPKGGWGRDEDRRWALETAVSTLRVCRGEPKLPGGRVELVEIDDDIGGPYPPYPRTALPAALRSAGAEIGEGGKRMIALYSDIRAWKGRPGISDRARRELREALNRDGEATVLLFSHPRLANEVPEARNLLAAWGGEALMQEAAAAWLTGSTGGLPTAAGGLDR